MEFLMVLWVPIVVSAVVLFVAQLRQLDRLAPSSI